MQAIPKTVSPIFLAFSINFLMVIEAPICQRLHFCSLLSIWWPHNFAIVHKVFGASNVSKMSTLSNSRSKILAAAFLDLKPDLSNKQQSGGDKVHLGPFTATSLTIKQAKILWWCHQNKGKEQRMGAGGVEVKTSMPMGVVAGLGKCEKGWVKYEKRGKSRVGGCEIFVKCFTLVFLVKYFTSFYAQSFSQRKIFYNFNYILHAIKHLKMRKYFILKKTEQ